MATLDTEPATSTSTLTKLLAAHEQVRPFDLTSTSTLTQLLAAREQVQLLDLALTQTDAGTLDYDDDNMGTTYVSTSGGDLALAAVGWVTATKVLLPLPPLLGAHPEGEGDHGADRMAKTSQKATEPTLWRDLALADGGGDTAALEQPSVSPAMDAHPEDDDLGADEGDKKNKQSSVGIQCVQKRVNTPNLIERYPHSPENLGGIAVNML
jgi:hypothetical protein